MEGEPGLSQSQPESESYRQQRATFISNKNEAQVHRELRKIGLTTEGDMAACRSRFIDPTEDDLVYDRDQYDWQIFKRDDEKNESLIHLLQRHEDDTILKVQEGVPCRNSTGMLNGNSLFYMTTNKIFRMFLLE